MDIKREVEKIVKKATSDKTFGDKLKKNPIEAVQSVVGSNIPVADVEKIAKEAAKKLGGNSILKKIPFLNKIIK